MGEYILAVALALHVAAVWYKQHTDHQRQTQMLLDKLKESFRIILELHDRIDELEKDKPQTEQQKLRREVLDALKKAMN